MNKAELVDAMAAEPASQKQTRNALWILSLTQQLEPWAKETAYPSLDSVHSLSLTVQRVKDVTHRRVRKSQLQQRTLSSSRLVLS